MAEPLMQSFGMNAEVFSFVSSLYFYSYAAAQIPVGLLLDRFGGRRLLSLSCLVISLGSLLFALSHVLWILGLARILIGFGSAFAFIGVLKLASNWFPERRYPLMVGLTNSLGVAGAIFGQAPLAALVQNIGWQESMIVLSIIGVAISVLIWFTILDCPICLLRPANNHKRVMMSTPIWPGLKLVLSSSQTWVTALYAGLMVVPIIAFGELWAVPFLTKQYQLSSVMAANINSAIFIGIGFGGPLNGWLSGLLRRQKTVMLFGNLGALISLIAILYINIWNDYLLFAWLFCFGFCTSSMLIAFTLNKQRFEVEHNGTVAAFTNMIIVILGAFFQDFIGFMLDHWLPSLSTGDYSIADYHAALSALPLISVTCLVLLLFIKKPITNHSA
jgi:MFS family permease